MVRFISDSAEKKKKTNTRSKRRTTVLPAQTNLESEEPYLPGKEMRAKQTTRKSTSSTKAGKSKPSSKKPSSKQKHPVEKEAGATDKAKKQRRPSKPKSKSSEPKKSEELKTQDKQKKKEHPNKQAKPEKTAHRRDKAGETDKAKRQTPKTASKKHASKDKDEPARKKQQHTKPIVPWSLDEYVVPKEEGKVRFHDLELPEPIMHAVADLKFQYCTPIQAQALPPALTGQDVSGKAQTGTGKTAAFLITIFTRLLNNPLTSTLRKATPRALVIAPTRELAKQIAKEALQIAEHTSFNVIPIYGGKEYAKQKNLLAKGAVDLVIATPGRLLDLKRRHDIHLGHVEIMVIDEADRMLDMGFIPSVRQIINSTPPRAKRQTLLFSATLTPDIIRLAGQWMKDPVTVEIEPTQVAAENIDQRVYIVTNKEKFALLYNLLQREQPERALIFTNRRDTADHLMRKLNSYKISCSVLSGALPQNKRERTLEAFRSNNIKVLVATDVAGRGLHVDNVSHVFNYNIPVDAEDYVHRIGRTGRAGLEGVSISFACDDDAFYIPDIEKYLGKELVCLHPEAEWLTPPPPPPKGSEVKDIVPKQHRHHRPSHKKHAHKSRKR